MATMAMGLKWVSVMGFQVNPLVAVWCQNFIYMTFCIAAIKIGFHSRPEKNAQMDLASEPGTVSMAFAKCRPQWALRGPDRWAMIRTSAT
jgi:hypothetical protein